MFGAPFLLSPCPLSSLERGRNPENEDDAGLWPRIIFVFGHILGPFLPNCLTNL